MGMMRIALWTFNYGCLGLILVCVTGCGHTNGAFSRLKTETDVGTRAHDRELMVVAIGGYGINILGSTSGGFAKTIAERLNAEDLEVYDRIRGMNAVDRIAARVGQARSANRKVVLVLVGHSMGNNRVWDIVSALADNRGVTAIVWVMLDGSALRADYPFKPRGVRHGTPRIPQGVAAIINVYSEGPWAGRHLRTADLEGDTVVLKQLSVRTSHFDIASPETAMLVAKLTAQYLSNLGLIEDSTQ